VNRVAFEIYGRGFGWAWRLRGPTGITATGSHHYESSRVARQAVDEVRTAAAMLSGDVESFPDTEVTAPTIITEEEPTLAGELPDDRDNWVWRLRTATDVLGHSADRFPTEAAANAAAGRFLDSAAGALPMFLVGAEHEWAKPLDPVTVGGTSLRALLGELTRGVRHRNALESFDTRIVVSGTRGKSSTTRRLDDVFSRRGYDTLTKITGNHPTLIHNGDAYPIERRGPRTTLYENVRLVTEFAPELAAYDPSDVAIFENQGITEYTTRLFNQRFAAPDILVLTNVRQDHTDTLGDSRGDLARAFGRSVPAETHVISGEQHPLLHEYMTTEIERRGGTIEQVDIPSEHEDLLGAETIHAVDAVLAVLDEPPLPEGEVEAFLDAIQPHWTDLPNGRVYNAAEVNDVESTEMVRRSLAGSEMITPFVYLRRDRRGRTASFAEYVDLLQQRDLIEQVHAGGASTTAFAGNTETTVEQHDQTAEAATVLDALLEAGRPVILMGNTVDGFMRDLQSEIETRARDAHRTEPEVADSDVVDAVNATD
jgi:hypothetical protein